MISKGPWSVLRRRWVSVVVMALLGLLGGLGYLLLAPVVYSATATSFFSLTTGNSASDLVQGSTYAQNQVDSFARLATTPVVLQPVIDDLDLGVAPATLATRVQATVPVGTVMVEVTVSDRSAERSAVLANAVVTSLSEVVEAIAPKDDAGEATVLATTVQAAEVPVDPAWPHTWMVIAAAVTSGLVAGGALAWARESLDTRVRDAQALAEMTDVPIVGTVGAWSEREAGRVVMAAAPHSPAAESIRQLRTNLQFLQVAESPAGGPGGGAFVVSLTSALSGEGKSTVSSNLAVALAETGARVLLVDADLRRPTIAGSLGLEGGVGLTTVLAGQAEFDEIVQEWGSSGLHVLPSGRVPPNPAELLGSPAMAALLGQLRAAYDFVVIDTAPLLPVADAAVLSRLVDGTVVIAHVGRVRRAQLAQALGNLDQVSARILGVVLNQVDRDPDAYGYGADADAGSAAAGALPKAARDDSAGSGGSRAATERGPSGALPGSGATREPVR